MSDINPTIKINIDTAGAVASIKSLQKNLSDFHTAMSKAGAEAARASANMQQNLVNSVNASGKFAASITTIKTTTESFTASLEKNKFSLGEYFRYSAGASKSFGKYFKTEMDTVGKVARERVKDLQTQYIQLGRDANGAMKSIAVRPLVLDLKDLSTQTQIAAQKQQILNELLSQGSTKLLNFGKNTQWAGRQLMVGFSVPLSMAGVAAARAYMQIEQASVKFKRVYGDMQTTSAEANKMANSVQQLAASYTKYGVSVSDTMNMAADAAAMGKTGTALLSQIDQASKLAVLGGVDQKTALQTTISLTNAFGTSADQLSSKINFLNAVENQTVLSIEDMTTAIPKAAPIVKQLGGNVEDLTYFLTAMKEGGINASEGANALKSGLSALINPSKKASDFLQTYGVNVKAIVEKDKGDLKKTVLDFANALNTLDPLNRSRAIEMMFGKFQFARMSTMFQNITKEGSQAAKVMQLATESPIQLALMANRELQKVQDSPMYKFQKSLADFQLKIAPVGEQILKIVTPIMDFATKMIDGFNHMNDGFKNFIVIGASIGGIIAPALLMVIGLVANGAANILKFFSVVKSFLNKTTSASQILGEQTNYLTSEQIKAEAVAASLEQTHRNLTQAFTSETEAIMAYRRELELANKTAAGGQYGAAFMPRRKFANGGLISGPGTGTSDSIAAMVSSGEFVMPAAQTRQNLPLLQSILFGGVRKYAQGGYVYAPGQELVETHLQEGHKLSGQSTPLTESLISSRPQMANLSSAVKDKIIALGKLTADLPRALNENLKRPAGVAVVEFEKAWNGTNEKLFKAVAAGMKKMGKVFDPSSPAMMKDLQNLEAQILANVKKLSAKTGIVNDAVLSQATQMALSNGVGDVSQALSMQGNSLREYRTTYSKEELVDAISSGVLKLETARTGGGRIVDATTGTQVGRLRSTSTMSKQEQMAMYTSLSAAEQKAFLSQMGLRSDSKFVAEATKAARNLVRSQQQAFLDGAIQAGGVASPAKETIAIGKFYGEGFLIGAKESYKEAKIIGTTYADYLTKESKKAVTAALSGFGTSVAKPIILSMNGIKTAAGEAHAALEKERLATLADAEAHSIDAASQALDAVETSGGKSGPKGRMAGFASKAGKVGMVASGLAFGASMLPGQVGEIANGILPIITTLSMIEPLLGLFGTSIEGIMAGMGGLAAALPPVAIGIAALGTIAGIAWLVNDANTKAAKKTNALADAADVSAKKLEKLGTVTGIKPIQSLFGGSGVGTTAEIKAKTDAQLLSKDKTFNETFKDNIGAYKLLSKNKDQRAALSSISMSLLASGYDTKSAQAVIDAIQIAAGKKRINFKVAGIDVSSKNGKAGLEKYANQTVKDFNDVIQKTSKNVKIADTLKSNPFIDKASLNATTAQDVAARKAAITAQATSMTAQTTSIVTALRQGKIKGQEFTTQMEKIRSKFSDIDASARKAVIAKMFDNPEIDASVKKLASNIDSTNAKMMVFQIAALGGAIPANVATAIKSKNSRVYARGMNDLGNLLDDLQKKIFNSLNKTTGSGGGGGSAGTGAGSTTTNPYADYLKNLKDSITAAKNQRAAYSELTKAGFSAADAVKAVSDASFVSALAAAKDAKARKILIDQYKELQKQLAITSNVTDPNALANLQVDKLQSQINLWQDALDTLKPKEDAINSAYDKRVAALDEMVSLNQQISDQQQGQLDLADALSKGDVASAAKTAQDIRAKFTANALEREKKVLSDVKDAQLQALTVQVGKDSFSIAQLTQMIANNQATISGIKLNTIDANALTTSITNLNDFGKNTGVDVKLPTDTGSGTGTGNTGGSGTSTISVADLAAKLKSGSSLSLTYWKQVVTDAMNGKTAGSTSTYTNNLKKAIAAAGGATITKAMGGFISGPGSSTSDSIPAMLSNGEYVIRANSVSKYGIGMLSKINAGDFGVGSLSSPSYSINSASNIPSGAKANYANVDNSSVYNSYSINVTASSGMSTEDVANAVMTKIKQYGDRNIRGNRI